MATEATQEQPPNPTSRAGRAGAVSRAAEGPPEQLDGQTQSAATEWFMSDEVEELAEDTVELNVGTKSKPKWVPFKIQVVDRDRIREIRRESTVTTGGGTENVNDVEANTKIVIEGLLDPDLSKPEHRVVRGQKFLDPADALVARFAHKPGLIDQLAGAVVNLSGYDDGDVREVKAAGN